MNPSSDELATVNSRKYDGSIRRSWNCKLLQQTDRQLIFVGEFDRDVSHPDLGEIARGTLSFEYYWLDRWYNVFCFFDPNGNFRNFYCNINMPPVFCNGVLDYVDLDLDVIVWPDGSTKVLDEAEFEANARLFSYPETVRRNAGAALDELLQMINTQQLPVPDHILQLTDR